MRTEQRYSTIVMFPSTKKLEWNLNQALDFGRLIRTLVGGRYINHGPFVKERGLLNIHKCGVIQMAYNVSYITSFFFFARHKTTKTVVSLFLV